jgi:hypothetical protein
MTDEPTTGSVSFWERIGKLGILGVASLGVIGVSSYAVLAKIEVPNWYIALVVAIVGGTGYIKSKAIK